MNCIRNMLLVPFLFLSYIDNHGITAFHFGGGIRRPNLSDVLLCVRNELFKTVWLVH